MKTLVYDSETTGFVEEGLPDDHPKQPHLVQLGCRLFDGNTPLAGVSLIVRPDGWEIPKQASNVHGITTDIALAVGIPRRVVLAVFTNLRAQADRLVCHNLDFDEKVMAAQLAKENIKPASGGPTNRLCTMRLAEPIVKLPATERMKATGYGHKFKAPQLAECIKHFFNEDLAGAHDAMIDADTCARVLFHLEGQGLIAAYTTGADVS